MALEARNRIGGTEDVLTGIVLLLAALAGAATPAPAPTSTPAARAPLAPATRVLRTPDAEPRWRGAPISLNLREADLTGVLRSFAELSGLNFVVFPEVRGSVTVSLTDVPWDQALDLILRVNGYGCVIEGRVVLIGPVGRLAGARPQGGRD